LALGDCRDPERISALAAIVRRDVAIQDICTAVFSSLATGAEALLSELVTDHEFTDKPDGQSFITEIAREIGARGDRQELASLAASIVLAHDGQPKVASDLLVAALQGAGSRAASTHRKLVAYAPAIQSITRELVSSSIALANDDGANPADR